ncbi:fatty acid desaturase [Marivibrio halodurans]|uniref:Fatty acid desaturase n=1 Tax=Marivibrio halodurans TaxID=2039722 RepID=A0A8J7SGC0_9PROT|nr:fatty acid desaturase [Marivibrio halodurans]MBP5855623.1 fatty acid desaturase [Marivibrio halodurans]
MKQGLPKDWSRVSNCYGVAISSRILLPFLGAFVVAPYLVTFSPWLAIPVVLTMGIYGYKISFILHDCSHNALFSRKSVNLWVGRVCGWMVGVNYDVFRQTHLLHHSHNGQGLDPQHGEVNGFGGASRGKLLHHLLTPLLGMRAPEIILGYGGGYLEAEEGEQATLERVADEGRRTRILWLGGTGLTQIVLALIVANFGMVPWAVLLYPLAVVTVGLFLARMRTFAEHCRPEGVETPDFTRSHRPNWVDSLLLYDAHFNYHLEHHLFPQIPSNRLRNLYDKFGEQYHTEATIASSMFATVARRVLDARG